MSVSIFRLHPPFPLNDAYVVFTTIKMSLTVIKESQTMIKVEQDWEAQAEGLETFDFLVKELPHIDEDYQRVDICAL